MCSSALFSGGRCRRPNSKRDLAQKPPMLILLRQRRSDLMTPRRPHFSGVTSIACALIHSSSVIGLSEMMIDSRSTAPARAPRVGAIAALARRSSRPFSELIGR
jgi:hypothetical protein